MKQDVEITKSKREGNTVIVSDLKKKYQVTSRKVLLTAKASASLLGYSPEHFSRLKADGDAPTPTKHRNRDFYTLESLKEWGKKHGINIDNVRLAMD